MSILRGLRTWRLSLRTRDFLDMDPDPNEVPSELVEEISGQWVELRRAWDEMYPENPVESDRDDKR